MKTKKLKQHLLTGLTVLSLCGTAQNGMDYTGPLAGRYSRLRSNFPLNQQNNQNEKALGVFQANITPQSFLEVNSTPAYMPFPMGSIALGEVFRTTSPIANNAAWRMFTGTGATAQKFSIINPANVNDVSLTAEQNGFMKLATDNAERLRVHHLAFGAPMLPFGANSLTNFTNPLPGNNLTRVSISRDGSQPVTRPLSLLHIGYDWPFSAGSPNGTAQGGFRSWQDLGTMYMAKTDNYYTGLREKDPADATGRTSQVSNGTGPSDGQDAVVTWGDNSANNAPNPSGSADDNLTFIFHGPLGNNGDPFAGTDYGREVMRMLGEGKVGIGPVFFDNAQPQNMLHVNNSGTNTAYVQVSNAGGTGQLFSDGFHLGIDAAGVAELNQKENTDMRFFTNNTQWGVIKTAGRFGINTNTPGNRVEINSVATDPTLSGLRFTNLTSASPTVPNPNVNNSVLAVDANGDVIYVPGASGGGGFGNLCTALQNPLTGDFEIPLATNKYLFTGQSLINNTVQQDVVAVGYNCGQQLPPAKFSSLQQQAGQITTLTFGGHFKNTNIINAGYPVTPITPISGGVFGESKSTTPNFSGVNAGGVFEAGGSLQSVGVLGRTTKNFPLQNGARYAIGGAFISDSSNTNSLIPAVINFGVYGFASNSAVRNIGVCGEVPLSNNPGIVTNYAIFGKAPSILFGSSNPGTGSEYAGYFDGDVTVMGVFNSPSDMNLKQNIDTIPDAINIIKQLKPKQFDYKISQYPNMSLPGGTQYGLIAQDVQSILPEIVTNNNHPAKYDNAGNIVNPAVNYKGLEYQQLIPFLIRAVQQLSDQNHKQDSIITLQSTQLAALTQSVNSCCSNSSVRTTGILGTQIDVELSDKDVITLSQNVPNPYAGNSGVTAPL